MLTTRLALILALVLLALAVAQWRLRAISSAPGPGQTPPEAAEGSAEWLSGEEETALDDLEEPQIDIPEYIPPAVTERPRPPMGFPIESVEVEIAAPRVGGATEEAPAEGGRD